MSARVGINGFGRVGRLVLRAARGRPELAFMHVNDPAADAGDTLVVQGTPMGYSRQTGPGEVPWGEPGVDVVLECSGRFRTRQALDPYFETGVLNASLTDCVFEVVRPTTVREVDGLLETAAEGPLAGILGFERRPLVSVDFKDDPRSAIVDAQSTMVTDETQVKILAWHDNEWGSAHRMAELARIVAAGLTGGPISSTPAAADG